MVTSVSPYDKDAREKAADDALGLLMEEQQSFEAWRDSLETVPTIKRLRNKAEVIRATELEKAGPYTRSR